MAILDYSHIPVQTPPPGVLSNFVDPPNQTNKLFAVSAVLIVLSTIFLLLRFYTRLVLLVRTPEVGDYLLLTGYAFAIANSVVTMHQTNAGLGRHGWDIPLTTMFPYNMKHTYFGIILYILSLGFTKTAILCLYLPISPTRTFRLCVWILIGIVAGWTLTTLLWSIFYCNTVSDFWDLEAALAKRCGPKISFLVFTGSSNVGTDLAILVLPILMLRHITLPIKKKIGIVIVLATGSFVSVISMIRMVVSIQSFSGPDFIYDSLNIPLWSSTEMHIAVVCGCMPTLKPLIRAIFAFFQGDAAHDGAKTPHRRNRDMPQEIYQELIGDIQLHKAQSGNSPAANHEEVDVVVTILAEPWNTSEERILSDRNSDIAKSNSTRYQGNDRGKDQVLGV